MKNLLFTVIVPGTVAVYVPLLVARNRSVGSGFMLGIALTLFVIGVAMYGWCVWHFAAFGRGTPLPVDAPKTLVVRGLYRYTRNPMYVSVLMVIVGWAACYESVGLLLYALLVGCCFHLVIVYYEERQLRRVFGREYVDYCAEVGRWLPRLPRHPAA